MTKKLTGLLAALALTVTGAAFAEGQKSSEYGQKKEDSQAQQMEQKQHQLSGRILSREGDTLYVEQEGAVVPLKFDNQTKFSGVQKDQLQEGQEIRATFMAKNQKENVAREISGQPVQEHQLSGQILSKEGDTLYVEQEGTIVPLKYDDKTKFSQVKKDQLKEGQEIRATFKVKDQKENVASEISLQSGGVQQQPMEQPMEQGGQQ